MYIGDKWVESTKPVAYRPNGTPVYDWDIVHDGDLVPYIVRIDGKPYIRWATRAWQAIYDARKNRPNAKIIAISGSYPEMVKNGWW